MIFKSSNTKKLNWIDALKAFAILGILLNHAVESFHIYPWFSNPSESWPSFAERMSSIFPKDGSVMLRLIQFLGWLGDMGPGVFILASGLTLTMSGLSKTFNKLDFYRKRATRIYPLYISIHIIILIIALFFFKWGGKSMLLWSVPSILGLRFTNNLFFFLNPSWWFIWLIIQMYLVFPFLLDLLKKKGAIYFLTITLLITLISRSAGILGYTFSAGMYVWMTGLFGGTRLFEFTFGMYIGYLIETKNIRFAKILNDRIKLPVLSILIYILGFLASWTYFGSIFSNILITIGLSGIFYSFYEFTIKRSKNIQTPLLWIGRNSFSAFLIHQPFMIYFGSILTGYSKTIVLGIIIILSFIIGHVIEKYVNRIFPYLQKKYILLIGFFEHKLGLFIAILLILGNSVLSFFILFGQVKISRYISALLLLQILYLTLYRVLVRPKLTQSAFRYLDIALFISVGVLLFRGYWLPLLGLFTVFSCFLLFLTKNISQRYAVMIVFLILITGIGSMEFYLNKHKPIETSSWGELPALRIDNETIYSLIPNKVTHLIYNNYDYFVKTNSLGFTSPEIDLTYKTPNEVRIMIVGDAFSMPEGMNYKFSYPFLLEKKLQNEFPKKIIHVINAGVTGYGPVEEYAQLNKYIDTIQPDIVINQLFINEFSEINDVKEKKLINIGLLKYDIYGKDILQRIRLEGNIQFVNEIFFYCKNLTHSNNNYNYNKSLLPLYEKNSPFYNDSAINNMNNFLIKMKNLSSIKKSKLIVLGVPGQIEVSKPKYISYFPSSVDLNDASKFDLNLPLEILQDLCRANNILYLNPKDELVLSPEQPVYFEESWHWNKTGHRVISNFLFEYLKTDEIFSHLSSEVN